MTPVLEALCRHIDDQSQTVIDLQRQLVAIPALGPENSDGPTDAELPKARFLAEYLAAAGLPEPSWLNAPDERVTSGSRPNLACVLPGEDASRTFWIIGHTDVVPPGDLSLWDSDPWALRVEGDRIYGRGVEDNHQGIVSGLVLARAFVDKGLTPPMNLGLLFVADEETGSGYGLDWVLRNKPELFGKNDIFMVPDFGTKDSTLVEVAEKSMLWVKVTVQGRQCHASTPAAGLNTLRVAARFIVALDRLQQEYPETDELFDPPHSTFEPTKKEANVPNVNTVPGQDVFYIDCRVLPCYNVDDVLESIRAIGRDIEEETGARIDYQAVQYAQAAPPTPVDSEAVRRLLPAIRKVYGSEPRPAGIGGGTVAAFLRRTGHHAVVWSTCVHNAHQPNEYSLISDQLGDAKVFAYALFERV